MKTRTDEARYSDPSYVAELENFKETEMVKARYQQMGFSPKLAEVAANAELSGSPDLLKRAFALHRQETGAKPEVSHNSQDASTNRNIDRNSAEYQKLEAEVKRNMQYQDEGVM